MHSSIYNIYIYIYCHPLTDYFILSELFSSDTHGILMIYAWKYTISVLKWKIEKIYQKN